jgi:hypothetical protein
MNVTIKTTLNKTNKKIVIILFVVYAVSWVLPIRGGFNRVDPLGITGVVYSLSGVWAGARSLINLFGGEKPSIFFEIVNSTGMILLGLPNILYVLAFFLYLKSSKKSLYFIIPCVVLMLSWGIDSQWNLGFGYYLWLLSGIGLLWLSGREYKRHARINTVQLLASGGVSFTYVVLLIMMLRYII